MILQRAIRISVVLFILATGAFCAETRIPVKFKETSPITTAYGYELGQGRKGDIFEVQEARGAMIFGFYPTEEGGIRGYVLLSTLDSTEELEKFVEAEKKRREKLRVALKKKLELSRLP